jgi:cysteine desulfurase
VSERIYLDNQSTTRVDPRVIEAMLPYLSEHYGNAGSITHPFGTEAAEAVDEATATISSLLGTRPKEIIFTSGATESNNLALLGAAAYHSRRTKKEAGHIVSVATEHRAVLDPLAELAKSGWEVTLLPVAEHTAAEAGRIDIAALEAALRDDTLLVSVMLANNEIGVIQPLEQIAALCKSRNILLHTDAAQAVGKIPLDIEKLGIDLVSFSGHKLYGPRGVGVLVARRQKGKAPLTAQLFGGGHQGGLRSGTLNVPAIVGLARAMELAIEELPAETVRLAGLRNRLLTGLQAQLDGVVLNGPLLEDPSMRLAGNLNLQFAYVDGESLMLSTGGQLALSAGSACTAAEPTPSHVLTALGLTDDAVRSSLRFGLGRFTTEAEIEATIEILTESVKRLRAMSSLAGD